MTQEEMVEDFLNRVQGLLDNAQKKGHIVIRVEDLENAFPELKERGDEKIRKQILSFLKEFECDHYRNLDFSSWIAWLEKQGECVIDCPQNHQDSNRPSGGIVLEDFNGGEGFYKLNLAYLNKKQVEEVEEMVREWNNEPSTSEEDIKDCIGLCLTDADEQRFKNYHTNLRDCLAWLEKQGEQKTTDVELRFKIGDWVVHKLGFVWHVDSFDKKNYQVSNEEGDDCYFEISKQDEFHLWTIDDAKDGDVLAFEDGWTCIFKTLVNDETFSSYCFVDSTGWFCETGSECHTLKDEFVKVYNGKIHPATKEQRVLLFQKMKEAGYEWDYIDKKVLKID